MSCRFLIDPAWPLWAAIWFVLGLIYTLLVRWLNDHPRYGRSLCQHAWLEVTVGNTLVAVAIWTVTRCGELFLLVMIANALLGCSQIIGAVTSQVQAQVRSDDEQIAQQ